MLVTFVLILFAQAKDFLDYLHVEAFAFGLRENFLFALVQGLDLFLDISMRSTMERMRSPAIPTTVSDMHASPD